MEAKKDKSEELILRIEEINKSFNELKLKKDNLLNNFDECFKNILYLWKGKIKNEAVIEKLYMTTAKLFDFALSQKDFNFIEKLTSDEKSNLMKYFYMTYDRFTSKKECMTKPQKLYSIHQTMLAKEGIGSLHRTLFTTQK